MKLLKIPQPCPLDHFFDHGIWVLAAGQVSARTPCSALFLLLPKRSSFFIIKLLFFHEKLNIKNVEVG